MASICTSNVTSGFIDLATFDEIEKYMYGGSDATAYFVRETRKSTWFTTVPVVLSRASGTPGFGQDWAVSISRAGDYLLQTWSVLRFPRSLFLLLELLIPLVYAGLRILDTILSAKLQLPSTTSLPRVSTVSILTSGLPLWFLQESVMVITK